MQLEEGQCPECRRRTYGRVIYKTGQKIKLCVGCMRSFDFETGEQIANDTWSEISPGVFKRVACPDDTAAARRMLPQKRNSETFELRHNNHTAHVTVGLYPDGGVGEVFIDVAKAGSELEAWARDAAILFSIARQYRAPLEVLARALTREENGSPSTLIGVVADHLIQNKG